MMTILSPVSHQLVGSASSGASPPWCCLGPARAALVGTLTRGLGYRPPAPEGRSNVATGGGKDRPRFDPLAGAKANMRIVCHYIYAQKTTTLCRRGVFFLAVSLPAAETKNGARSALQGRISLRVHPPDT